VYYGLANSLQLHVFLRYRKYGTRPASGSQGHDGQRPPSIWQTGSGTQPLPTLHQLVIGGTAVGTSLNPGK